MLIEKLGAVIRAWDETFSQRRTFERAAVHSVADLCVAGRHTLSHGICYLGRQHADWSATYRLLSRSQWSAQSLFTPILRKAHSLCGRDCVGVAIDDTRLRKTGHRIPGTSWHADPLSPPFHLNIMWGLRFMQVSLLVPEYRKGGQAARGLPVGFVEAPSLRRPGKRATDKERADYNRMKRVSRLSEAYPKLVRHLRQTLDDLGAERKTLIVAADGSYCNRWGLATPFERTAVIARCRKDARLYEPATMKGRIYGDASFTPLDVRRSPEQDWRQARIFHGKRWRTVRYKEVCPVLWKGATRRLPLRLFVLAPTRYHKKGAHRKYYYREPAYLLTNNLDISAQTLLQKYFDRWQIEVNHQEEKDIIGVGQAQVRSVLSTPRQPAMAVAAYSALLLAGMQAYGHVKPDQMSTDKAWYRHKKRITIGDLVHILRSELQNVPPEQRSQYIMDIIQDKIKPNTVMQNVQT